MKGSSQGFGTARGLGREWNAAAAQRCSHRAVLDVV